MTNLKECFIMAFHALIIGTVLSMPWIIALAILLVSVSLSNPICFVASLCLGLLIATTESAILIYFILDAVERAGEKHGNKQKMQ